MSGGQRRTDVLGHLVGDFPDLVFERSSTRPQRRRFVAEHEDRGGASAVA